MIRGLLLRKWQGGDVGIRSQSSILYEWEDFVSGRTNADTTLGKLGWSIVGNVAIIASAAGRPGIVRITANNNVAWVGFHVLGAFAYGDTWDVLWLYRPNDKDANTKMRVGTVSAAARSNDPPADGVYFENINESNWFAVTRSSGTQTRTDTGVVWTAGTWYSMRIRRTSSTNIEFSINGANIVNNTTNIPTNADGMVWTSVVSLAIADKIGDADWADLLITGLSR